jgi:hypothetical protein
MTMILAHPGLAWPLMAPTVHWLRSTQARALLAAALGSCLLLGGAVVAVDRLHTTPADVLDHPADPVTDEQSAAQVVESAKQIVTLSGLRTASASYTLMSCKDRDDPPYQGAVYLTFALPGSAPADAYFPAIAATLVDHGWAEAVTPGDRALAKTLSKDAVTVLLSRQRDDPGTGVLRVYGQCRNMNDHHRDATTWVDITDQLPGPVKGP